MSSAREPVSSSGITVDASTGERYIPSSTRADGSKRREIRVRPGYRPPEDVELYRNRAAEAWKSRGKAGIPGAEGLTKQPDQTGQAKSGSTSSNKNAKRREARKKAKATEVVEYMKEENATNIGERRVPAGSTEREGNPDKFEGTGKGAAVSADCEAAQDMEEEKKVRNLKKKLRQAKELRDKKSHGEPLLPEQLEKVIKIQELIRQLDALGFDSEGVRKGDMASEKEI